MSRIQSAGCRIMAVALALACLPGGWFRPVLASSTEWSTGEQSQLLPGWETTQALFQTFKKGPLAQAVVALASSQCAWVSPAACQARFESWRKAGGLHPLTEQLLDRELADLARARGDTATSTRLSMGLGYLTKWRYAVAGSEGEALADPVTGWVEPSAYFRPPPSAALELETVVRAAAAMEVAIRLTGAWLGELCVNGECSSLPVLEAALWDDHVVKANLVQGENRIAVRFLAEGTGIRYVARVTQLSGQAYPMESSSNGVLLRPIAKAGKAGKVLVPGALGLLAENEDPNSAALRCLVLQAVRMRGAVANQEILVGLAPKTLADWDVALVCAQGTAIESSWAKKVEAVPGSELLRRIHALSHHLQSGELYAALSLATALRPEILGANLAGDPVCASQAVLLVRNALRKSGLELAELPLLKTVHQSWGAEVPVLLMALASTTQNEGVYQECSDAVLPMLQRLPGQPDLVLALFGCTDRIHLGERTLGALRRLVAMRPLVPAYRLALASALAHSGKGDTSDEVLQQALLEFPNQPALLRERASRCVANSDTQGALLALRRLLTVNPSDAWARSLMARLGGDKEDDPFKSVDDAAIRRLADAIPELSGVRFAGVLDRTLLKLLPNGGTTLWRLQALMAVQPEEGNPIVLSYQVDSQGQVGVLERALVLHTDGTTTVLSENSEPLLDDQQYNMFYDVTNNYVEFSDLQPGDLLVFGYRIDTLPSVLDTPFSELIWVSDSIPKWNTKVEISVPKGTQLFSEAHSPDGTLRYQQAFFDRGEESFHVYEFKGLPKVPAERLSPGWFEVGTYVHVSHTEKASEFGVWYAGVINKVRTTDRDMRELVERLRTEAPDPQKLVEAICRYVADEVRYVGLELGVHRLRPHSPAEVFRHGFGDCKDKSLLLVTLLELAGVKADVVAVATANRGVAPTSIISPALFNHAIVYLPEMNVYFDPTASYLGLGTIPWADMGSPGVIVKDKGGELVKLPGPERGTSELEVSIRLATRSDSTGASGIEGALVFVGENARRILPMLQDEGTWLTDLSAYLSGLFPVVELGDWSYELESGAKPRIVVKFQGQWAPLSGAGQPVMQSVPGAVPSVEQAMRTLPVTIGYPFRLSYEVSWPEGEFRVAGVHAAGEESDVASFSLKETSGEGRRGLAIQYEQKAHRIPLERIASWQEMALRFKDAVAPIELGSHGE